MNKQAKSASQRIEDRVAFDSLTIHARDNLVEGIRGFTARLREAEHETDVRVAPDRVKVSVRSPLLRSSVEIDAENPRPEHERAAVVEVARRHSMALEIAMLDAVFGGRIDRARQALLLWAASIEDGDPPTREEIERVIAEAFG